MPTAHPRATSTSCAKPIGGHASRWRPYGLRSGDRRAGAAHPHPRGGALLCRARGRDDAAEVLPRLRAAARQEDARQGRVRHRVVAARRLREDPGHEPPVAGRPEGDAADARRERRIASSSHGSTPRSHAATTTRRSAELAALRPALGESRYVQELAWSLEPDAYWRQATWRRLVAIGAGPGINLLFAFVLFAALFMISTTRSTNVIARVESGSPAAARRPRAGDRILSVAGRRVKPDDISHAIRGTERPAVPARRRPQRPPGRRRPDARARERRRVPHRNRDRGARRAGRVAADRGEGRTVALVGGHRRHGARARRTSHRPRHEPRFELRRHREGAAAGVASGPARLPVRARADQPRARADEPDPGAAARRRPHRARAPREGARPDVRAVGLHPLQRRRADACSRSSCTSACGTTCSGPAALHLGRRGQRTLRNGRRRQDRRRRARRRAVDDDDEDARRPGDGRADRRARERRLRDRARRGAEDRGRRGARQDRSVLAGADHRRHPFQREPRAEGDRPGRRGRPDQPRQHRRPGEGRAGRAGGEEGGDPDADRRELGLAAEAPRGARAGGPGRGARRGGAGGGAAARGARLPRLQDLGEVEPRADDDPRVPDARRQRAVSAASRRHRGGHGRSAGRSRAPSGSARCSPRGSATRSACRSRPIRSRSRRRRSRS